VHFVGRRWPGSCGQLALATGTIPPAAHHQIGMTQASFRPRCPAPVTRCVSGAQPLGTACSASCISFSSGTRRWCAPFGHGDLAAPRSGPSVPDALRLKSEYRTCFHAAPCRWPLRSGLVDQFGNVPGCRWRERPAERWCSPPTPSRDLPRARTSSGREDPRPLPLAEAPRLPADAGSEHASAMPLVPAENMGAGRSEQEISLTAGQILCVLQSLATPQDLGVSTLLATGAPLTGDPLEAGSRGVAATVTPPPPPPRPRPCPQWEWAHPA